MVLQFIETQPPHYQDHIRYNNYHEEFLKAAKSYGVKIIHKWVDADDNSWHGFLYGGLFHLFKIPCKFPDVDDYLAARKEGFTSCNHRQWERLKELGYENEEAVDTERGEYSIDQWIVIKSQGYSNSEEFDELTASEVSRMEEARIKIDISNFTFHTAIIDGNNISYGDYEDTPKLRNIICVYEKLEELGVKPYVVVSAALRHKIDDPLGLVEFLKKDDVAEAPADRPDDFFVIQLAMRREAFIVSNDRFNDWKKANPELAKEIETRRVALTFIEDEPQFDHKLYTLIKKPARHR